MVRANSKYEQKAIELLVKVVKNIDIDDILAIRYQSNGYTNHSYVITLKNKQRYVVRIGLIDQWLKRDNEALVLELIKQIKDAFNVLYFDSQSGDMVRLYISGITPGKKTVTNYDFLDALSNKLQKIHGIKYSNKDKILRNDFYIYKEFDHNIEKKYSSYFYECLSEFEKTIPLTFCHNDFSPWNMIYQKKTKQLTFIDFEWSRLNFPYFDLVNFIKEANIHNTEYETYLLKKYDPNIDHVTITKFLYISCYFSFVWSYSMYQYKYITSYRKRMLSMIKKLYKELH